MTRAFDHPDAQAIEPAMQARRDEWVGRVRALVDQIEGWSRSLGWVAERDEEDVIERNIGAYSVPVVRIHLPRPAGQPQRALLVTPVALEIGGRGDGRVDLEGYPTLSRVKLIGTTGGWEIMTDSNVPLRLPWNQNTFRQLAEDLVA